LATLLAAAVSRFPCVAYDLVSQEEGSPAGERPDDETVRAALIEAARSIKSDYERGGALDAIFK
jgi:hypothetical protein